MEFNSMINKLFIRTIDSINKSLDGSGAIFRIEYWKAQQMNQKRE